MSRLDEIERQMTQKETCGRIAEIDRDGREQNERSEITPRFEFSSSPFPAGFAIPLSARTFDKKRRQQRVVSLSLSVPPQLVADRRLLAVRWALDAPERAAFVSPPSSHTYCSTYLSSSSSSSSPSSLSSSTPVYCLHSTKYQTHAHREQLRLALPIRSSNLRSPLYLC